MKPDFALSLSVEGINLLVRGDNGWHRVGGVSLDSPSLAEDLAGLRRKATELGPAPLLTKLIIPNDQIRYLKIEARTGGLTAPEQAVRDALDGATPYDIEELAYDTAAEDGTIFVAAVARETLAEAESFADEHGFNPLTFVAVPDHGAFPGEPFFGMSRAARKLLSKADSVEPDDSAVIVTGDVVFPVGSGRPHDAAPIAEQTAGFAEDPARATAFSTRRRKGGSAYDPDKAAATTPPKPLIDPVESGFVAGTTSSPKTADSDLDAGTGGLEVASSAKEPTASASTTTRLTAEAAAASDSIAAPHQRTSAMTPFDKHETDGRRAKSRHLGLIMTGILILVLVVIAILALVFLDDPVSRWFGVPNETEIAVEADRPTEPAPSDLAAKSDIEADAVQPPASQQTVAAPSAVDATDPAFPPTPDVPSGTELQPSDLTMSLESDRTPRRAEPGLTAADEAVLDVLRDTSDTPDDLVTEGLSGIDALQLAPPAPMVPGIVGLGDLYLASIDRTDLFQDAVALPSAEALDTDLTPNIVTSPAAAGTLFSLDSRGLVTPTVEGALNPDGVLVYLGRPAVVPPATPERPEVASEGGELRTLLAGFRPRPRPADLTERVERTALGGFSRTELITKRPEARPKLAKVDAERDETPTALAIASSRSPQLRPGDLAVRVPQRTGTNESESEAEADGEPDTRSTVEPVAVASAKTVAPRIPSSASVARQATIDNAINLRKINLIGVYGTPSNRRALLRLPSGRYKKVKVGDTVDGGRVLAIGDNELRYRKGGRNMTLKIPSG